MGVMLGATTLKDVERITFLASGFTYAAFRVIAGARRGRGGDHA